MKHNINQKVYACQPFLKGIQEVLLLNFNLTLQETQHTCLTHFSIIFNRMSDFVYQSSLYSFNTPVKKQQTTESLKQLYFNSFKRQKERNKICSLCLFQSDDCSSFRCRNRAHIVCTECACDWEYDKMCPVCKKRSPRVNITESVCEDIIWMENEKRMNSYKKASETDSKIWSEDLNGRTTKKSMI